MKSIFAFVFASLLANPSALAQNHIVSPTTPPVLNSPYPYEPNDIHNPYFYYFNVYGPYNPDSPYHPERDNDHGSSSSAGSDTEDDEGQTTPPSDYEPSEPEAPTAPASQIVSYTVKADTYFKAQNVDSASLPAHSKCFVKAGTIVNVKQLAYKTQQVVKVVLAAAIEGCSSYGLKGNVGFLFVPHISKN